MRSAVLFLLISAFAWTQTPVIVDTDAGSDDLIALIWLMRQPEVRIEAVTIVQGLAHPAAGAESVLRLLEAGGLTSTPVYVGSDRPFRGSSEFPSAWRTAADQLLRDEFPPARRHPEVMPASRYLARRLMDSRRPIRVLALGPLTNLAHAVALEPRTGAAVSDLTWMGGTLDAAGNVPESPQAEWNAWIDPEAAERVLNAGWIIRMVPLDATNRVPIGGQTLRLFEEEAREWTASLVLKLLRSEAESIRAGRYYAWDVLAAMSLSYPKLLSPKWVALAVRKRPNQRGRLVRVEGAKPNALAAVAADPSLFARLFRALLP